MNTCRECGVEITDDEYICYACAVNLVESLRQMVADMEIDWNEEHNRRVNAEDTLRRTKYDIEDLQGQLYAEQNKTSRLEREINSLESRIRYSRY